METLSADQRPDGWSTGAATYDTVFAPFTGAFADDAVRLLKVLPTDHVIDVAAGSGAFARRAAATGATVLATDFAPGMLDVLAGAAQRDGLARLSTEVMDGQALSAATDTFDVACSMFGLIFFPNIDLGLREMARVVRTGGRMAISCWDLDGFRLMDLVTRAVRAAAPDVPLPGGAPPWARLGAPHTLAAALIHAGWADVTVHALEHPLVIPDPITFFHEMTEWSTPARAILARIPEGAEAAAARAFAVAVEEAGGDRIPTTALLGTGTAR